MEAREGGLLNQKMKIVGLTGGIGSGKSSILKVFSKKGIPVYNADINAKRLMHENIALKKEIIAVFGADIYQDNELDRERLAKLVFDDKSKLERLNALIHPAVRDDFTLFLSYQNAPYVIKEAAILFETGGNEQCDAVVLVTAPESVRIARVMERDHTDSSSVKKRVAHQWSDEDKIPMADYVINNIDWDETLKKIDEIHIDLLHKH